MHSHTWGQAICLKVVFSNLKEHLDLKRLGRVVLTFILIYQQIALGYVLAAHIYQV